MMCHGHKKFMLVFNVLPCSNALSAYLRINCLLYDEYAFFLSVPSQAAYAFSYNNLYDQKHMQWQAQVKK